MIYGTSNVAARGEKPERSMRRPTAHANSFIDSWQRFTIKR